MTKTIIKWFVLVALLAYVVVACCWATDEAAGNVCKGIDIRVSDVRTTDSVTRSGIMKELGQYQGKIIGIPSKDVNTFEIEKYLGAMPQFESVECCITTKGNLLIDVVPMVPEVRVFEPDKSYYINKDGKKMESKASFFVDVPVVSGNFNDNFTALQVLPVVKFVEKDSVMKKLVGMVYAKGPDDIFLVPRIKGHIINFGDTTRMVDKKQALLAFYRRVMPYKGWEEYDTVSVKFRGQIVASRRDKTKRNHGGDYTEDVDPEESTLPEI